MLPDSIAALRRPLDDIATQLGLTLAPSQTDDLLAYLSLLLRWNQTYNLTAVREPKRMLVQHIADCLAVIGPLRRQLALSSGTRRILDVGSGGGLPGVVIAIAEPTAEVVCIDTARKKAAFVQQVAGSLRLRRLRSVHARIEHWPEPPFDVITSRAFAQLADFTRLTEPLLHPSAGVWLAMKGKLPTAELQALPSTTEVFHVEQLVVPCLEADRCLVWMRPVTRLIPR